MFSNTTVDSIYTNNPFEDSHGQIYYINVLTYVSMSTSDLSRWTWEEDKQFEDCILDSVGRWEEIAACLGTKSAAEVEHHYALLLKDMEAMEAGEIEPPAYLKCSKSVKRKMSKAKPWTEDEHR